jgi:hypothetical protein
MNEPDALDMMPKGSIFHKHYSRFTCEMVQGQEQGTILVLYMVMLSVSSI